MSEQKMKERLEAKNSSQNLKKKFEDLKNKKVEKASTRIVNFYVKVGCGCGGSYDKYHAEVPVDSKYKEREIYSDFPDDYIAGTLKEGWV